MTDRQAATRVGHIRFDWIVLQTAAIWRLNFNMFGLLALLILSPAFLFDVLLGTSEHPLLSPEMDSSLGTAVSFVASVFLAVALTIGTYRHLRSEHFGLKYCVRRAMDTDFGVVLVGLISFVLLAFGFLAFVVPGLLVATVFFVAVPVIVLEDEGVIGSLQRSASLTGGNRWRVFVILLVAIGISLGLTVLLTGVVELLPHENDSPVLTALIDWVHTAIESLFIGILTAVTYFALRQAKEGVDVDELSTVFD